MRCIQRWVGGAGEEFSEDGQSASWTHYEQCGGKITPRGHRIDGQNGLRGREVGRWRLVDQIVPVAEETADAISDHAAMVYSMVMVMVIFSALVRSHQSTSPVASASSVPRG